MWSSEPKAQDMADASDVISQDVQDVPQAEGAVEVVIPLPEHIARMTEDQLHTEIARLVAVVQHSAFVTGVSSAIFLLPLFYACAEEEQDYVLRLMVDMRERLASLRHDRLRGARLQDS